MDGEFLTVREIADRLKVNQQTVRNWIDRGELCAVRIGSRRVRVRRSDLDVFVDARGARQLPELGATSVQDPDVVDALRELSGAALKLVRLLDGEQRRWHSLERCTAYLDERYGR